VIGVVHGRPSRRSGDQAVSPRSASHSS
jgi:hypothetical protein